MFTVVYDESRKSVCLVPGIKHCCQADCVSCSIIADLMADVEVSSFIASQKFEESRSPVLAAMCDNFKGWGEFEENALGITSNVCHTHATGNVQVFCTFGIQPMLCAAGIAATTRSHVKQFPTVAAFDDYHDIVVDVV